MLEIWIHEFLNAIWKMNFASLESSEAFGLQGDPLDMLSLILMTGEMPKMPSGKSMVKMVGELSFHTTPGVEVEVVVVAVVVVEVEDVLVQIRNAMNVVSLVILLESAGIVVVLGDVGVAALLDTVEAQVMDEGVIVPVAVPPLLHVVAYHREVEASAGHHPTVEEKRCHTPMEMALGKYAGAGAELRQK